MTPTSSTIPSQAKTSTRIVVKLVELRAICARTLKAARISSLRLRLGGDDPPKRLDGDDDHLAGFGPPGRSAGEFVCEDVDLVDTRLRRQKI